MVTRINKKTLQLQRFHSTRRYYLVLPSFVSCEVTPSPSEGADQWDRTLKGEKRSLELHRRVKVKADRPSRRVLLSNEECRSTCLERWVFLYFFSFTEFVPSLTSWMPFCWIQLIHVFDGFDVATEFCSVFFLVSPSFPSFFLRVQSILPSFT